MVFSVSKYLSYYIFFNYYYIYGVYNYFNNLNILVSDTIGFLISSIIQSYSNIFISNYLLSWYLKYIFFNLSYISPFSQNPKYNLYYYLVIATCNNDSYFNSPFLVFNVFNIFSFIFNNTTIFLSVPFDVWILIILVLFSDYYKSITQPS